MGLLDRIRELKEQTSATVWIPDIPELTEGCHLDISEVSQWNKPIKVRLPYQPGHVDGLEHWDVVIERQCKDLMFTRKMKFMDHFPTTYENLGPAAVASIVYELLHERTPYGWHHNCGEMKKVPKSARPHKSVGSYRIEGPPSSRLEFIIPDKVRIEMIAFCKKNSVPISQEFTFSENLSETDNVKPSTLIPFLDRCFHKVHMLQIDATSTLKLLDAGAKKIILE